MKAWLATITLAAILTGYFPLPAHTADPKQPVLYHVVWFKFKPAASADQIKTVEDAFSALKTKIPGIDSYNWGTNISPEKKNKGFTHCFILTFHSDKDRDTYLVHPEHKAFGKIVGPTLDDVAVIDFWSKQ